MNKKIIAGGTLSAMVLAGGFAGMVSAQSVADETGLTEEQVIEIALMEVPGEVLEVELERERGSMIYQIEVLTAEGEEMEVEIEAESGDVLRIRAEDGECDHDDDDHDDDDHDDDEDDDDDEDEA